MTETLFEKLARESREGTIPRRPQFNVEQQAKSGLGQLQWLKASGPFEDRSMADAVAAKLQTRTGLPTRVVDAVGRITEVKA